MVLVSSATASSSASIEFTSGIDSTYKEYKFFFVNIHPQTDNVSFTFNLSSDGGSNYNVTKTSSYFWSYHLESDGGAALQYVANNDLAQSTGEQILFGNAGLNNENDGSFAGTLTLFNPSSTTYVKHWISEHNGMHHDDISVNGRSAGYANTTSAINAIRFKMSSGNIDDGKILCFGLN
ncbi:MAG: hypothetical protein VW810_05925, partial [Pelagibacteraceae bacterium]